jgi:murein DD-endopeptidase MepM/ murein hydrolase activator NlpD
MRGNIFISYRRGQSPKDARALYERLRREFGEQRVFIDLEGIEPGDDFVATLERHLEGCVVLVALIGRDWVSAKDELGRPRLEDENDFVRIELRTALRRGIRVIPVLVDGALPPTSQQLPTDLQPLVRRQAVSLDFNKFDTDTGHLIRALHKILDGLAVEAQIPPSSSTPHSASPRPAQAQPVSPTAPLPAPRTSTSPAGPQAATESSPQMAVAPDSPTTPHPATDTSTTHSSEEAANLPPRFGPHVSRLLLLIGIGGPALAAALWFVSRDAKHEPIAVPVQKADGSLPARPATSSVALDQRSATSPPPPPVDPLGSITRPQPNMTPFGESSIAWAWPSAGTIVARFDSQRRGILLSGSSGEQVLAAADGRVTYASSRIFEYGNLVLVQHGGDYTTVYACNEALLVRENQAVRRGQGIATMGSSCKFTTAVGLHFEIRHRGQPLDPLAYLPTRN